MGVLIELGCNLLVLLILKLQRLNLLLQILENAEQGGHNEYLNERTNKHTTNGCGT